MKLHVLGLPHTETIDEFSSCAYTQRTRDFASFMTKQGYEVVLYAGERNDAACTEHVPIMTRAEQAQWFPGYTHRDMFDNFNAESKGWTEFNTRCADAIFTRASARDVLCVTMGVTQRDVMKRLQTKYALACKDFDLLVAETGIGYSGVWAPYRVFESAAWRHYMASKEPNDNLRWFDTVIPRGYFTQQFPFGFGGVDYLYLGRLISRKGVKIAAETCQRIGARLLVAGQGVQSYKNGEFLQTFDGTRLEGNVQYLGVLNPTERAAVMGQVRAVFMPTWYLEPGGGVAIEAQLCGTPVITTPWGAMTETVLEGPQRTGFHCSVMSEFVSAAEHVETLDRVKIRQSAQARFSSKVIASKYDYYFKRLQTLYREGWYQ